MKVQSFIDIATKGDKKVCENCKHLMIWGTATGMCWHPTKRPLDKQLTQSCKKFEFKTSKTEEL